MTLPRLARGKWCRRIKHVYHGLNASCSDHQRGWRKLSGSARWSEPQLSPQFPIIAELNSPQFRESSGESRFNLRAIAANISELLRSLDKPPLAELPFFVGC
jgi:hypothetical protein